MRCLPREGAMASCVDIAQTGFASASAIPCIVASPIRTPVNEPGPRVTAKMSIEFRSVAVSLSSQSTAGSSFSFRELRPSIAVAPSTASSRTMATERIGSDVSAARISIEVPSAECRVPSESRARRQLGTRHSALGTHRGWHPQVDQFNSDFLRDLARAFVAIELAEIDLLDARVGDELEAVPARRGRGVELAVVDADAVLRRLKNRVRFGVYRRDAVAIFHDAAAVLAMRKAADRSVIPRRQDGAVADDHRADML